MTGLKQLIFIKNLYESNSSLSNVAENCEVWRAELVKQSGGWIGQLDSLIYLEM